MRSVNRSALVPYSDKQMYGLVADVAAYPDFLPWCTGAEQHAQSATEAEASIGLGVSGLNTRFRTRNKLDPPHSMTMELVDGPFSSLHGYWRFVQLGEAGCEVHLQVDFEISGKAQDLILGVGFEKICNSLLDAFVTRARSLYAND